MFRSFGCSACGFSFPSLCLRSACPSGVTALADVTLDCMYIQGSGLAFAEVIGKSRFLMLAEEGVCELAGILY